MDRPSPISVNVLTVRRSQAESDMHRGSCLFHPCTTLKEQALEDSQHPKFAAENKVPDAEKNVGRLLVAYIGAGVTVC